MGVGKGKLRWAEFDRIFYIQIKLQRRQFKKMSTEKVSRQLFMSVKERLDYYRLPCGFPVEATPLIDKLLNLVSSKGSSTDRKGAYSFEGQPVNAALKHQIARVVKENNKVHMDLIVAKEQIQSLEHRLFKFQANRNCGDKEMEKFSAMKHRRQQDLVDELRDIKYKYNELMDFLHEDPRADREYIKRLMKHKQVNVQEVGVGERKEVGRKGGNENHSIRQLEFKVKNRQTEILRLQKLVQYDGVSMNKLINNFNDDMAKKHLKNADSKINYLEQSYGNIKKENKNMRGKNGLREALRSEVEKCHQLIATLKKQNADLRRNHKQQNFSLDKKSAENERKIGKIQSEKTHADKRIQDKEEAIQNLSKRVEFLQKQLIESKEGIEEAEDVILERQVENENIIKKNEELKVFFEYELDSLKKKVVEIEAQNDDHKIKARQLVQQLEINMRQNQLKSESIINLEKIVNELIRKNSVIADKSAGTLEESLKQSAELEIKSKMYELERHNSLLQEERVQLETNLRTLEHRFAQVVKESERFKFENGTLRGQLSAKEDLLSKVTFQMEEARIALRRQQSELARATGQIEDLSRSKSASIKELASENQRLSHQEKALKLRVKDLQIKRSEEQGVWEVTRQRLEDKQNTINQLERLLSENVQQTKRVSSRCSELDHQNHELTLQNRRLAKRYEQLKKDDNDFKNTSYKNYEAAITDSINEAVQLKKDILMERQSNEVLTLELEEANKMLNLTRQEKEQGQFDKISFGREVEILKKRMAKMEQVERELVLENESLRSLARSM